MTRKQNEPANTFAYDHAFPIVMTKLDLGDAKDKVQDIQQALYNVRTLFRSFDRDTIDGDAMRAAAGLCGDAIEMMAETTMEDVVRFFMALEQQIDRLPEDYPIKATPHVMQEGEI